MGVLNKLFKPGGTKFYILFESATANLIEMSRLFTQVTSAKKAEDRKVVLDTMGKLEDSTDKLAHKLLIELGGNYITPFDREDIHYLASTLDEIAHDIWGISRLYNRYDIKGEHNTLSQVGENLVEFFLLLDTTIKGLRDQSSLKSLIDSCEEMRALSSSSDKLLETSIANVVNQGAEYPKTLIQQMDYYELLQTTVGNCRKAVSVIEGIIIKYG